MGRARCAAVALLLVGLLSFPSRRASAQSDPRTSIDRFEPSERGSEWFLNESLDFRGSLRPAVGAIGTASHRPFVLTDDRDGGRASVVRNFVALHAGASLIALRNRVRVAANLPVQLFTDGTSATSNGALHAAAKREQGIGDLRLGGDVRIVGNYRDPFILAAGAQLWAPTGEQSQWASDGTVRFRPRVMIAGSDRLLVYAARIDLDVREHSGAEVGASMALGVRTFDNQLVIGPEADAATSIDDPFAKRTTLLEGLFGAHWLVANTVRIGGAIGRGFTTNLNTNAIGAPDRRIVFSLEWAKVNVVHDADNDGIRDEDDACPNVAGIRTPKNPKTHGCPSDRDGDQIPDAEDACIDVPGIRSIFPRENGCPPDRDHDSVPDSVDACPDRRGVKTSDPRTNGCPPDADRDGLADEIDACPAVPGIATNDPKTNGCPPDTDGDGIDDLTDACPNLAGPHSADPKIDGCPDLDRDKDGVLNADDACPDDPGLPDSDPRRSGCPRAFVRVAAGGQRIEMRDQPKFAGAAAVAIASPGALDLVVEIMKTGAAAGKKIKIEGHSDNREKDKAASEARARAVMKWLIDHGGIDASRLTTIGVGADRPADTNETELGRAANRRIELHIE